MTTTQVKSVVSKCTIAKREVLQSLTQRFLPVQGSSWAEPLGLLLLAGSQQFRGGGGAGGTQPEVS